MHVPTKTQVQETQKEGPIYKWAFRASKVFMWIYGIVVILDAAHMLYTLSAK